MAESLDIGLNETAVNERDLLIVWHLLSQKIKTHVRRGCVTAGCMRILDSSLIRTQWGKRGLSLWLRNGWIVQCELMSNY
jgi:hypothetical protein